MWAWLLQKIDTSIHIRKSVHVSDCHSLSSCGCVDEIVRSDYFCVIKVRWYHLYTMRLQQTKSLISMKIIMESSELVEELTWQMKCPISVIILELFEP